MTMLSVSYAVAAVAIFGAALYLFFRLRPYVTTSTILVGSLLLIYGPAFLNFTLTSGEPGFLVN
jgi:NO-binding membrane sensor protein with MHYT domain